MDSAVFRTGTFVGRVWSEAAGGPCVVHLRNGAAYDVTSPETPTLRDLTEAEDPLGYLERAEARPLASVDALLQGGAQGVKLLAPVDLQAVKACGVTFARSMLERVIEERAAGAPERAAEIRERIATLIGTSLRDLEAGSPEAERVKAALIEDGLWSQYLEVGIGPDAEVFSKAQTLSSVGHGDAVGLHPKSTWNNPEPEIVLSVNSRGTIVGATLGNDVNLRDFEGRSALLLSKAKDNNASCSIGPFLRLFDDSYDLDNVRRAELDLLVTGEDGFTLIGKSSMSEISRDPLDLVAQTVGRHHQYPDGFVLFLGTLFAPIEDRDRPGAGFTHKIGDKVRISNEELGTLENVVRLSTDCPPWTFGLSALTRNLATRRLFDSE